MKLNLDYGETGLVIDVPDDRTTVVEPRHHAGLMDPDSRLRDAPESLVLRRNRHFDFF